jgi:hypothetical protein
MKPYWTARSAYFDELKAKGVIKADTDTEPSFQTPPQMQTLLDQYYALPFGTGQRSAFTRAHPELVTYWDEKTQYTNQQRALLGLPPLEDKSFISFPRKKRFAKITAKKLPRHKSLITITAEHKYKPKTIKIKKPPLANIKIRTVHV